MAKSKGKSLDIFLQKLDRYAPMRDRAEKYLAELGDGWEYESEFMRNARIAPIYISRIREDFAAHVVALPRTDRGNQSRTAWAGTPKLAKQMRAAIK